MSSEIATLVSELNAFGVPVPAQHTISRERYLRLESEMRENPSGKRIIEQFGSLLHGPEGGLLFRGVEIFAAD